MPRRAWFDTNDGKKPTFGGTLPRLESWQKAIEDGVIEPREVEEQRARLLAMLRELEPLLDDALHERVTRVLEEWTVLSAMQTTVLLEEFGGGAG
ncbi:MAG: hypothetical protein JNL38_13365 [Myxococcales bacterium]|jgi:hypothetical protein|nr:hypothetical protein [Myxococcales bacterium]